MSPLTPAQALAHRYTHLSAHLAGVELQPLNHPPCQALENLPPPFQLPNTADLYLGLFTRSTVPDVLAAHGVLNMLQNHPHAANVTLNSAATALGRDQIQMWVGPSPGPETTLLELTLDREFIRIQPPFDHPISERWLPSFNVDWLMLQDPWSDFSPQRPRAPGQRHPSAGVAMKILALFHTLRRKLGAAAMVTIGEFFHNVEIFSRAYRYIDPEMEGIYTAALRDIMAHHHLDRIQASWAFDWGLVRNHEGHIYRWPTELQVSFDTEPTRSYFESPAFLERVAQTAALWSFTLDTEAFAARWPRA